MSSAAGLSALAAGILVFAGCCATEVGPIPGSVDANLQAPQSFPGPNDFEGTFEPSPGEVTDGLQATYTGTVVVTMLPRPLVENALPGGTGLAASNTASPLHPVIHLIGEQSDPRLVCPPDGHTVPIPEAHGYQEMIMVIPFVVVGASNLWHNYAIRMYLDEWVPVFGGNWGYGYAKELAKIIKSESGDRVTHVISQPDFVGAKVWFESDIESIGPWTDASQGPPRWNDIKKILEMPVLGIRPWSSDFTRSYWEWKLSASRLVPATSRHRIVSAFRDEMADWPAMGELASAVDGAVSVRNVRWRLAHPDSYSLPCPPLPVPP